jgi:putative two-component system response regulator
MSESESAINKARILVADDDQFYRKIFSDQIKELGHECITVDNGLAAIEKAVSYQPDLLIIDVIMPGMGGFEVTRRLKATHSTMHIPVLIVTSLSDRGSKLNGLDYGADEILAKPVDDAEFRLRVKNLLKVKKYEDYLIAHGRMLEGEVNNKQAQLEKAYDKIRHGYIESVYRLTLAAEYRDKETGGHIRRISLYSQTLSRRIGLTEQEVEAVFFASPMHDVGKIGIPDSILLKRGAHTMAEREIMKTHAAIGAAILEGSDSEILQTGYDIAYTHHECWNGSGYPRQLKGEEIPMSGRIVNIVDIYDAIRSKRPYKESFDHEAAINIIRGLEEKFNPNIFTCFLDCADEFRRLFDEHRNE